MILQAGRFIYSLRMLPRFQDSSGESEGFSLGTPPDQQNLVNIWTRSLAYILGEGGVSRQLASQHIPRWWWFQTFFVFTPTWRRFPFWQVFFNRLKPPIRFPISPKHFRYLKWRKSSPSYEPLYGWIRLADQGFHPPPNFCLIRCRKRSILGTNKNVWW